MILTILSILVGHSSVLAADAADLRPLFAAIRSVETGGEKDPANAIGDGGRSVGPYQIGRAYHRDAWGSDRGYARVRERDYAERTMVRYWRRYDRKALDRGDHEKLARLHNGGCNRWNSKAAGGYWLKVRAELRGERLPVLDEPGLSEAVVTFVSRDLGNDTPRHKDTDGS